jgi:DNA-binding transcriptional ArsR family regulator
MPERYFDGTDLLHARFAVSPIWETIASVRALQQTSRIRFHSEWADQVQRRIRTQQLNLARLRALVPASGHLADFLTPPPATSEAEFATELAHVATTSSETVTADLELLLAQQPPRPRRLMLETALASPAKFLHAVTEDLARYWAIAIAPSWGRLRSLAQSDIAWRATQVTHRGLNGMFHSLHPGVRLANGRLRVETTCTPPQPAANGHGLVLVPCAFAWPSILVLDNAVAPPALTYAPRGAGNLWGTLEPRTESPLSEVIGRTRSAALLQLDLPMTTLQLAHQLNLSAPSINAHLKAFQRTGLVHSVRRGREVLYARTELGDRLAGAAG